MRSKRTAGVEFQNSQRAKEAKKQASGSYRNHEIAIIIDSQISDFPSLFSQVMDNFRFSNNDADVLPSALRNSEPTASSKAGAKSRPPSSLSQAAPFEGATNARQFFAYQYLMPVKGLCLWTHRSRTQGGHGPLHSPFTTLLAAQVVLLPAEFFLDLVMEVGMEEAVDPATGALHEDSEDEFPALSRYVQSVRKECSSLGCGTTRPGAGAGAGAGASASTSAGSAGGGCLEAPDGTKQRLLFVVVDLDKAVVQRQRAEGVGRPVQQLIDSACTYLALDLCVELSRPKSDAEVVELLQTVTHLLADGVYKPPRHALDCVKKIPLRKDESSSSSSSAEIEADGADADGAGGADVDGESRGISEASGGKEVSAEMKMVWQNMLRMFPGISQARAAKFSSVHSCPLGVRQAVSNPLLSVTDKQSQFQWDFTDKSAAQKKLSKMMFTAFTSLDPEDKLMD